MTKTYHDVEAVTRLLAEKEKDLELAAKIGQELLQRNKETEEKVSRLEHENQIANDTIIQLKHELQAKTDLLHVYTDDLEESSPLELRNINVEALQRKIDDLEDDNKKLHAEAFTLAQEAYKCEEKEEKLVKDAVQHLTQANYQIKDLHSQFTHKVDESSRQREEISQLLGQVCDLQSRVQRYSHENDDLTANLRVYQFKVMQHQETQDELTTELVDLKDKYREVVELLRDAQEDLRRSRKRTYPGMGKQTGMFTSLPLNKGDDSLQAEIHSSLHPSKKTSKADSFKESEVSDSDTDLPAVGSSAYRKAARTFRAIQASSRSAVDSQGSEDTSKAVGGSIFQSYTISRENSFSPDEDEFEVVRGRSKKEEAGEVSDDSGTGRSTGLSRPDSLASSAPKEELARELLRAATKNQWNSKAEPATLPRASKRKQYADEDVEVVEVQTVGVLQRPSFNISSSLLHSVPLGTVPGKSAPATPGQERKQIVGHPSMGVIPGKSFAENLQHSSHKAGSDFDETEPLGDLTTTIKGSAGTDPAQPLSLQEDFDETEPLTNTTSSLAWDAWQPSFQGGHPSLGSVPGGHPGLGSLPGGHSSLGNVSGGHPGLGSIPGGYPGPGPIPGGHPGLGSVPGGHPGLGMVPGGHPGLGSVPGYNSDPMTAQASLNSNTTMTSASAGRPNNLGLNRCWSHEAEPMNIGEPSKPREPSKFNDSGVMSGDYSEELGSSSQRIDQTIDIDAMSDGGFSDFGNYPGIRVPSKESSEPLSLEVESALRHLNPADVERRRKLMGRNYSYDLEYDDLGSPGVIAGVDEYFKSLPYGVDRPSSGLEPSDPNQSGRNSSATSYRNRRLPEKLRIVKPLEGSLTLHQWSRLATPHLGGVLEERVGIAMKGNSKHGLDPLFDMYQLEEEEEEDEEMVVPRQMPAAQTFNTLTNSTVLHPDTNTFCTSSYGRSQMSSGLPSRVGSRQSSRPASMQGSFSDLPSLFRDSNPTIGLNKLIGDRKISGARRSQLDISAMSAISSLTPSVLTSPAYSRNMSPTDTPNHTPEESLPGSPDDGGDSGIVYSFFHSLKTAIYGQQRKEHRQSKRERRMQDKRHKLRIMEAVEEVGVENILSEKEGTPLSMPSLSAASMPSKKKGPPVPMGLSDFDARYLGALDDFDELKDITPGTLTLTSEAPRDPMDYTEEWIGQLTVPSFSSLGRPSLNSGELGRVPAHEEPPTGPAFASPRLGGRGPGRIVSPGEARPLLGVPGRPGTGALGSKRGDLGTIPGTSEEPQPERPAEERGMVQSTSFVGSITNMFFGRKGGYS